MKPFEVAVLCAFGILGWLTFANYRAVCPEVAVVKNVESSGIVKEPAVISITGDQYEALFAKTKQHYQDTQPKRALLFQKLYTNRQEKGWEYGDLYNGLVPEVMCLGLVRIGAVSDGGKWVCNPWAMPDDCAIYSLGVNEDTTFERELQNMTSSKCKIYGYDKYDPVGKTVLTGMKEIRFHFKKALIGTKDDPKQNMVHIQTEMTEHGDKRVEILKIDIEGSEYSVLPDLVKATKMCQILVEMHRGPQVTVKLLNEMAQLGYRLFSYEINGKHHSLAEYSLIHDDCLERYQAVPLAYYLNEAHL